MKFHTQQKPVLVSVTAETEDEARAAFFALTADQVELFEDIEVNEVAEAFIVTGRYTPPIVTISLKCPQCGEDSFCLGCRKCHNCGVGFDELKTQIDEAFKGLQGFLVGFLGVPDMIAQMFGGFMDDLQKAAQEAGANLDEDEDLAPWAKHIQNLNLDDLEEDEGGE